MNSAFCDLSSADLSRLALALRSGRLAAPFSVVSLRRYLAEPAAGPVAAELQRLIIEGAPPGSLADWLEILCSDRALRGVADDLIDIVWTGPEPVGIVNRDTGVVVRELFAGARESVLVAGYAVYQGRSVFKELADRMERNPGLDVQMFLDVQRPRDDRSSPSELVRRFAERFVGREWPGPRRPAVYYDPRSLETDPARRASLHAKCVVVDRERVLASSANFTEAAQTKNIEVGLLIHNRRTAERLCDHFHGLAAAGILKPVPLGP